MVTIVFEAGVRSPRKVQLGFDTRLRGNLGHFVWCPLSKLVWCAKLLIFFKFRPYLSLDNNEWLGIFVSSRNLKAVCCGVASRHRIQWECERSPTSVIPEQHSYEALSIYHRTKQSPMTVPFDASEWQPAKCSLTSAIIAEQTTNGKLESGNFSTQNTNIFSNGCRTHYIFSLWTWFWWQRNSFFLYNLMLKFGWNQGFP